MTAQTDLPAPLIPHDTDIAGLTGFMLNVERLFASELWALSTGEEFKAAVALWGRAWQQTPPGSLPNDEKLLAAFSGAGTRWRKIKPMALHGFVLCSDNRWYHRFLCEDVARAAKHKDLRRERTAAATRARQARDTDGTKPPDGGKKLNGNNETADRNVGRNDERNVGRNDSRNEVRHEERNAIVATTLREPLRSPIDKTRQDKTPVEDISGDRSDPVPDAVAAAPRRSSREDFQRVEARCREVLPRDWVNDPLVSPMVQLEYDGLDLEREIVPALLDIVASKRVPIRTWSLLANLVAERVATLRASRTAQGLTPTPQAPTPEAEQVDMAPFGRWPEQTIRSLIARHRDTGAWIESCFGPPPGQPGCRVPPRLLIGEAA